MKCASLLILSLLSPSSGHALNMPPVVTCAKTVQQWHDLLNTVQGDGNWSVALPGGKDAWVTGDNISENGFQHNSIRITNSCKVVTTAPAVPNAPNGSHWWLGPLVYDARTASIYSFAPHVTVTGPGAWVQHGTDLVQFDVAGRFLSVQRMPSSDVPDQEGLVHWDVGVWRDPALSFVYIYGGVRYSADFGFGRRLKLARVPLGDLGNWSAWQYWNGNKWSNNEADAIEVLGPSDGNADGVSVFKSTTGQFCLFTKKGGVFGTEIGYYSGPYLFGPWTWHKIRDSVQFTEYLPTLHPEAKLTNGKTLVVVSEKDAAPSWEEVTLP